MAHATFIAGVAGAWLTRDARDADLHAVFGYGALAALLLRLAWGFVGSPHARFASFACGPREALRYLRDALRGTPRHYTGHNPAGSWSVFALLALLLATALTGVAASAAMHGLGPLSAVLPPAWGVPAWRAHEWLAWAVLAMVALHLLGVAWGSRVHAENLAIAMVTGRKRAHVAGEAGAAGRGVLALLLLAATVASAAYYLARHVPADVEARERVEARLAQARQASAWSAECGSCHLAYAPALLPQRSWRRTLAEQDRHFGEDLALDAAAVARLLQEASRADAPGWGAWMLARSVAENESPLRVSELPAWRALHEDVDPALFEARTNGRHDCEACHRDAGSGIFHPRMIRIPKPKVGA